MFLIISSVLSGILYRMGGKGKPFNTKYRDFGCPIVALLTIYIFYLKLNIFTVLLSFGAMFGVMTTYWEKWGSDDVEWYEWALTGFFYGLSAIFIAYQVGNWPGFILRTLILSVTISLWSTLVSWDDLEEFGRGFLFLITFHPKIFLFLN